MKRFLCASVCAVAFLITSCSSPLEGVKVKPPVPTNIVLTAGDGKLYVGWKKIEMATSYNVYVNTNDTLPDAPEKTGIKEPSYTLSGLTNETVHYVWVAAVNAGGQQLSRPSQETPYTILPAPASVNTVMASSECITISWATVPNAVSYTIYRATNSTGTYRPIAPDEPLTGDTLSYSDDGLDANTTYCYKVRAVHSNGKEGVESAPKPAKTAPAAPLNFTAVAQSATTFELDWGYVSGASSYKIYLSEDGGDFSCIKSSHRYSLCWIKNSYSSDPHIALILLMHISRWKLRKSITVQFLSLIVTVLRVIYLKSLQ